MAPNGTGCQAKGSGVGEQDRDNLETQEVPRLRESVCGNKARITEATLVSMDC